MRARRYASVSILIVFVVSLALVATSPGAGAAGDPPPPAPPGTPPSAPAPAAAQAPRPAPTAAQKAEDYYKNIQAFKGVPADQLEPAMQFIAESLGVDCQFCHVERAPEKDDKEHKLIARKMIAMTAAINKDYFDGEREMTCNSCHRGAAHPSGTPAIATGNEPPEEAAEAKPAELPSADAVLAKYLQSVGGAEVLTKATSRIQKGKLIGRGPEPTPIEVLSKAPDKRISIVRTPRGDRVTAFDGTAGWLGGTGRPPLDMSAAEAAAARLDADFRFPLRVREIFNSFRVTPGERIDGHETVRVAARNEGQPPVLLFFDVQSGLLLRQVRYVETPVGRNPTQIDYADYRDAGGVKIPFRWTVARPGGLFTIQIDEVQPNVPIEDARFTKTAGS